MVATKAQTKRGAIVPNAPQASARSRPLGWDFSGSLLLVSTAKTSRMLNIRVTFDRDHHSPLFRRRHPFDEETSDYHFWILTTILSCVI